MVALSAVLHYNAAIISVEMQHSPTMDSFGVLEQNRRHSTGMMPAIPRTLFRLAIQTGFQVQCGAPEDLKIQLDRICMTCVAAILLCWYAKQQEHPEQVLRCNVRAALDVLPTLNSITPIQIPARAHKA